MENVRNTFLAKIYERLIQGDDNDIHLVFQDGFSTASRICLTALSPYFEAMFTHDMLEKNNGVVTLPTVAKRTFDDVQKFHFLGEDVVNDVNWFLFLDIADLMQLDALKSCCMKYLNKDLTLTRDTCIPVWRSSKIYGFDDLVIMAFHYVVKNLEELSNSGILTCLGVDEYLQVLSRDDLSQKEDEIIRGVQTWIEKHNPSRETMVELFKQIRFEYVSIEYLTDAVMFTSFVNEHEALLEVVQNGIKRNYLYKETYGVVENRISGQLFDVVFVLQNSKNILSLLCLTDKQWYSLPAYSSEPGWSFSGCVLGKSIYITGGSNQEHSTIKYNVLRKTWSRGPYLNRKRRDHCMAALDKTLYVIGGVHSNTIEQLQPGHLEWKVVGDLGCRRKYACAESVGENILVMGGEVDGRTSYLFHCFNTKTHAVCTINTQLESGILTRSYFEMPNLYLLHSTGAFDVIHIDDVNTPTLTAERVTEYGTPDYYFAFVYKGGSIIVFSSHGLQKRTSRFGYETSQFGNTPPLYSIFGSLYMLAPRLCLL